MPARGLYSVNFFVYMLFWIVFLILCDFTISFFHNIKLINSKLSHVSLYSDSKSSLQFSNSQDSSNVETKNKIDIMNQIKHLQVKIQDFTDIKYEPIIYNLALLYLKVGSGKAIHRHKYTRFGSLQKTV